MSRGSEPALDWWSEVNYWNQVAKQTHVSLSVPQGDAITASTEQACNMLKHLIGQY